MPGSFHLRSLLLSAAALAATGCSASVDLPATASSRSWIDRTKLVDLTHPFDSSTVYWPTSHPFHLTRVAWGRTPGGWWYSSNDYAASEHGGTHTDSPIHFSEAGWTTDQIPVDRLFGPAVVLDVREACRDNPDYVARDEDLQAWIEANGPIPEGAIVLVRTGWAERWPDRLRYMGSDRPGDASDLHFPGISEGLARALAASGKVSGVGIDSASLDPGVSKDFIAHRVLGEANIYGLENLANLDKLPPKDAILIALPMKIAGGTGGPTRVVAILP